MPDLDSNSFKAAWKSDFRSGEGLVDMALREIERGCDSTGRRADSRPDMRMGG